MNYNYKGLGYVLAGFILLLSVSTVYVGRKHQQCVASTEAAIRMVVAEDMVFECMMDRGCNQDAAYTGMLYAKAQQARQNFFETSQKCN